MPWSNKVHICFFFLFLFYELYDYNVKSVEILVGQFVNGISFNFFSFHLFFHSVFIHWRGICSRSTRQSSDCEIDFIDLVSIDSRECQSHSPSTTKSHDSGVRSSNTSTLRHTPNMGPNGIRLRNGDIFTRQSGESYIIRIFSHFVSVSAQSHSMPGSAVTEQQCALFSIHLLFWWSQWKCYLFLVEFVYFPRSMWFRYLRKHNVCIFICFFHLVLFSFVA